MVSTAPGVSAYVKSVFGTPEAARKLILADFFRHAFDGSGADNYYDAGSCIDGRLTSAWNWCSKKKKSYHTHTHTCTYIPMCRCSRLSRKSYHPLFTHVHTYMYMHMYTHMYIHTHVQVLEALQEELSPALLHGRLRRIRR